jgi:hypothetical protein
MKKRKNNNKNKRKISKKNNKLKKKIIKTSKNKYKRGGFHIEGVNWKGLDDLYYSIYGKDESFFSNTIQTKINHLSYIISPGYINRFIQIITDLRDLIDYLIENLNIEGYETYERKINLFLAIFISYIIKHPTEFLYDNLINKITENVFSESLINTIGIDGLLNTAYNYLCNILPENRRKQVTFIKTFFEENKINNYFEENKTIRFKEIFYYFLFTPLKI